MRTIVLTAALALAAATAGAASAQQQHRDRTAPGQGSPAPAATPAAPAASQARPVAPSPGEPEILLYGAKNYAGSANRITGAFPDTNLGGINSVRVNGQTWRICSAPNYTGACVNLSQSVPEFAAYFGPSVIRSLKRIDTPAPVPPVPPVAGGPRPGGPGGYPSGGQGRPPYGQGSGGDGTAGWRTASYLCSGGTRLTAAFDDRNGAVRIQTDRQGVFTLRQSPSRSGFRYEGAGRTFSGWANDATLAIGDSYIARCRIDYR